MNINLGEKLRKLRKGKGNTQEELAKFLNISVQSVSKLHFCRRLPHIIP